MFGFVWFCSVWGEKGKESGLGCLRRSTRLLRMHSRRSTRLKSFSLVKYLKHNIVFSEVITREPQINCADLSSSFHGWWCDFEEPNMISSFRPPALRALVFQVARPTVRGI
jgi:hypothetical protein